MKLSKKRNFENSESEVDKMIKKGLAKVSVFMMAVAMAASVAACTPENKNGGGKSTVEMPVQSSISMENTEKANKPEKKKKKEAKTPAKEAEVPKKAEEGPGAAQVQGPGAGQAQGPGAAQAQGPGAAQVQGPGAGQVQGPGAAQAQDSGNQGTIPEVPADSAEVKPSIEPSEEKGTEVLEGAKEQGAKKDEKKPEEDKQEGSEGKKKLSQKKSDNELKKKSSEKKSDGKQVSSRKSGTGQKNKPAA